MPSPGRSGISHGAVAVVPKRNQNPNSPPCCTSSGRVVALRVTSPLNHREFDPDTLPP